MSEYTPWAYCDVRPDGTITYYGLADDHQTQIRPNVQAVDTRRWVEEAVAWLGTQGWQLVGAVQVEDDRTFYFKRPIQNQTAEVAVASMALETATATVPERSVNDSPEIPIVDPARLIEEEFLPE